MANLNNEKDIQTPSRCTALAEFIGIVLGDGNVYAYVQEGEGVATYVVRITGHSEETDYYINYITPLCQELFGEKPKIYYHKTQREIFCNLYGKQFVQFLRTHGIKPGNKIENQTTIPAWIFEDDKYLRACVRGLIDTDGSIYKMDKWVQICFKNKNMTLLRDTQRALRQLGFFVSKITWNKIYVSRRAHIHKFFNEVGFSNPKHRRRYRRFYSPVV